MLALQLNAKCFLEVRPEAVCCKLVPVDATVRKIATYLGDTKLIAKLAQGDMVATEASYHKACITRLWNMYRRASSNQRKDERDIEIEADAFAGIISWLNDNIAESLEYDTIPVYTLKTLFSTYQEKLAQFACIQHLRTI